MEKLDIKPIDMDFWNNAKKDIVLVLDNNAEIESASEMARIINRSYSVTVRHLKDLEKHNIIKLQKTIYKVSIILTDKLENIFRKSYTAAPLKDSHI